MNKLLILCGLAVVSTTFTPEAVKSPAACDPLPLEAENLNAEPMVQATTKIVFWDSPESVNFRNPTDRAALDLKSIPYLEEEDSIDLGFDTDLYLPSGFDPYKTYFDYDAVVYIEAEDDNLDMDTASYLPEGFNPYAAPDDFMSISYMEDEADEDLGFDTAPYLPAGFDAYEKQLDLKSIVYLEENEDFVLGFDTAAYLPEGFNPYSQ